MSMRLLPVEFLLEPRGDMPPEEQMREATTHQATIMKEAGADRRR